jgi:hypothetical protein
MAKALAIPTVKCACGATFAIPGHRIGDTVECTACRKSQVVLRSRVEGEVPPADGAPGQVSDRLPEVAASLERIRLRRAGHAARGVALYPLWAIFGLGVFGFYLPAFLTGQNTIALGFGERGRRIQALGIGLYAALIAGILIAFGRWHDDLASHWAWKFVMLVPLVGSIPFVLMGRGETMSAFEAGAKPASPAIPAILGLLLAVAQFFAVRFVDLAWYR